MQELIDKFSNYDLEMIYIFKDEIKQALEKEKEQTQGLINALEDIKNWDDDLEVEWGDCGERARAALKFFNQTK